MNEIAKISISNMRIARALLSSEQHVIHQCICNTEKWL